MTIKRSRGVDVGIIWTIYRKEMLEVLRDRRTLFLLVAVPLIFYPLLLILVAELSASQAEKIERQPVEVALIGSLPEALASELRDDELVTVAEASAPVDGLRSGELDLVIEGNSELAGALERGETGKISLHYDSVRPASAEARKRVAKKIDEFEQSQVLARLKSLGRDQAYIEPVEIEANDIAPPVRRLGSVAAMILPVLILVFMVTGAFYPAIDLTAGEKERKTIQTLLTAPLRPLEIVTGKYLTVFTMALLSGVINLLSMVLIATHSILLADAATMDFHLDVSAVDVASLLWTVVLIGIMFSAIMMTIATFAKTPKDAQAYISPVYMVCLLPMIISQVPGIELGQSTVFVPVLNLSLLMKEILVVGTNWENMFLVTVSTLIVTTLVLLLAARLYSRQELLVSPGGLSSSFSQLSSGVRSPRPGIDEALALLSVLFVLLFYAGSMMQSMHLMAGLATTLFGLILAPTVAFVLVRKHDLRRTFHLKRPPTLALLSAILIGASSFVWLSAVMHVFHDSFLPIPEPFIEAMQSMLTVPEGWSGKLLAVAVFALSPAICEEALFRGVLLSSFRGKTSGWVAVGVTAVLFGLFHLSVYRFAGTATLGLFMGFLVWRTGSIWPAVLFHFTNNAIAVLSQDLLAELGTEVTGWLIGGSLVVTLVGGGLLFFVPSVGSGEPSRSVVTDGA